MRVTSYLNELFIAALQSARRFPLVLLVACLGALDSSVLVLIDFESGSYAKWLPKLIFICYLGLPLFLALYLFAESQPTPQARLSKKLLLLLGGCFLFGFGWLYWSIAPMLFVSKWVHLNVSLHLAVAVAPFLLKSDNINGFWQFNRGLFFRFLESNLFAVILGVGLSVIPLAITGLFDVRINDKVYPLIWIFAGSVFMTWHFLAGIPRDIEALEHSDDSPKIVKVLTQYILIPLVSIYGLILYAYGVKVILAWDLPRGIVSWMIIAIAIAGLLNFLLLYPQYRDKTSPWIRRYQQIYFVSLFPLLALLSVALFRRVSDYGVTVNRYFLAVLGLWLFGVAVYFLLSRRKNIKLIPLSLCIIGLLSFVGPWSAYQVSYQSQVNRLKAILTSHQLMIQDEDSEKITLTKATQAISKQDRYEIGALFDYIIETFGHSALQNLLAPEQYEALVQEKYSYNTVVTLFGFMELDYVSKWNQKREGLYKSFYRQDEGELLDVAGYDLLLSSLYPDQQSSYKIEINKPEQFITVTHEGAILLRFDLSAKLAEFAEQEASLPHNLGSIMATSESAHGKLVLNSLSLTAFTDTVTLEHITGKILLKQKSML